MISEAKIGDANIGDAGIGDPMIGKIVAVASDGSRLAVTLNVGLNLRAAVPLSEPGAELLVEGASVWVRIPQDSKG